MSNSSALTTTVEPTLPTISSTDPGSAIATIGASPPPAFVHDVPWSYLSVGTRRRPQRWLLRALLGTFAVAGVVAVLFAPAARYTAEARFLVEGAAATGVSYPTVQGRDAAVVAAYLRSRDAVAALERTTPLRAMLTRPEIDPLSRVPGLLSGDGFEALYRSVRDRIDVAIEEPSGIVSLSVVAHRPEDAQQLAEALLIDAERLVNAIGSRARTEMVAETSAHARAASLEIADLQEQLTALRAQHRMVEPEARSSEIGELGRVLSHDVTALDVEITRLAAIAPNSPRLPSLRERRISTQARIDDLTERLVGSPSSVAAVLSTYEILALQRDAAVATFAASRDAVSRASATAQSTRLYLQRISGPNQPDRANGPTALQIALVIAVLAATLLGDRQLRSRNGRPA